MYNNNKYDLAIAYRIYPKVSKIPPIYPNDKYKLSELCLKSLANAIKNLKVKIFILFDKCPESYHSLFKEYLKGFDHEFLDFDGIGNSGTFLKQIELLSNQNYSDYIYFAEDDYFYLPNSFSEMLSFFQNSDDIDFVTSYDHLDYYENKIHKIESEIRYYYNRHWRTSTSTCLTFLTSKKVLESTYKTFLSYTKRNYDASLWFALTKKQVFRPSLYIKSFNDNELFRILGKMWLHNWKQILFNKKRKLWSPIPSLSTHMDNRYLAPGYNWELLFKENI